VIGEEPGSDYGRDEENHDGEEQQPQRNGSGSEREQEFSDGSDGYGGEEDEREGEDRRSESEREQEYLDGSEEDGQQAHADLQEDEEELPLPQPHGEEQQRSDGSDGGNGVEDEQQVGEEQQQQEEEAPQAHGADDAVAVAGGDDLAAAAPRPSSPAPSLRSESSSVVVVGEMTVDRTHALDCGICFLPLKPPIFQVHARLASLKSISSINEITRFSSPNSVPELVGSIDRSSPWTTLDPWWSGSRLIHPGPPLT